MAIISTNLILCLFNNFSISSTLLQDAKHCDPYVLSFQLKKVKNKHLYSILHFTKHSFQSEDQVMNY